MRKLLMIFLMILLVALIITIVIKGIKIGNFQIFSYKEIQQANEELNKRISEASVITSTTYQGKMSDLNISAKRLLTEKEQYQDKIAFSSPEEIQKAKQFAEFKQSFLSVKLGNYATKEGIDLTLQYVAGTIEETGDLHFIVKGKYYSISEFLRDIENDKDLYFRIENFVMLPNDSTEILKAEFDVKGIKLDVDNSITNPTIVNPTDTNNTTTNVTNTNTINTNTTSTNTNTTNNTNT